MALLINSTKEELNNLDLYSKEFFEKVFNILKQKYKTKITQAIKGKKPLINNQSPKFHKGFISDFGAGAEEVQGNILYFILNHEKSPLYQYGENNNAIEELSGLLGIKKEDIELYIDRKYRMPNNETLFNVEDIIARTMPNWFFQKIKENIDKEYTKSRNVSQLISTNNKILNLSKLSIEDFENIQKDFKSIKYVLLNVLKKIETSYEFRKLDDNGKKIYLSSKIQILSDLNLELKEEEIKKQISFSIAQYNKISKEKFVEENHSSLNFMDKYFNLSFEDIQNFPIVFPYFKNNTEITSMALRTLNKDAIQRYKLFGKTAIEKELKKGSEYLFIIEGKMDKISLQTALALLGISNVSFITLSNANAQLDNESWNFIKEEKNLKIINMLDNDTKGLESQEKILSKLFKMNKIESVFDFTELLQTTTFNDLNDILMNDNENKTFQNFFENINKYQLSIKNKGIIEEKNIVYANNNSELIFLLNDKNIKTKTVYVKIQNGYVNITQKLDEILEFYNMNKEETEIKTEIFNVIKNYSLPYEKIKFLLKGKKYINEDIYVTKEENIYLVENPSNIPTYRSIYKLPNTNLIEEKNKLKNPLIEQFIYDNCDTAAKLSCNEKLKTLNIKKPKLLEDINSFEDFEKWWLSKILNNITSFGFEGNIEKEILKETIKEINLVKEVYVQFKTEKEKKEFIDYFLTYDLIEEEKQKQGIFEGIRGSAASFLSFSIMGYTKYRKKDIEYILKHREIFKPERFLNKNKVSLPDIDNEVSPENKPKVKKIMAKMGYLPPLVKRELSDRTISYSEHPSANQKIPEEIYSKITEETEYIPLDVKGIDSELKYDSLSQQINRNQNIEISGKIKLKDILFKELPQLTEGVQKVLLKLKNIELPSIKKLMVQSLEEGVSKYIPLLKINDKQYLDTNTQEIFTEEEIKSNFKNTFEVEEDLLKILSFNNFSLKELEEYFPNIYQEYLNILEVECDITEVMLATSSYRPAFSGNIYKVFEEYYYFNNNEKQFKSLDNSKSLPYSFFHKQVLEQENILEKNSEFIPKKKAGKNIQYMLRNVKNVEYFLESKGLKEKYNKQYKTITLTENEAKQFENNLTIQLTSFYKQKESLLVYEFLEKNKTKRNYFTDLNITKGFIKFQEQMDTFIQKISIEYLNTNIEKFQNNQELINQFIENWKLKADTIRKFSSKSKENLTTELINEAKDIFIKIEQLLKAIEPKNKSFYIEAKDIINKQFFTLENGAYLYNASHGYYVSLNALEENEFRNHPEKFQKKPEPIIDNTKLIYEELNKIELTEENILQLSNKLKKGFLSNEENKEDQSQEKKRKTEEKLNSDFFVKTTTRREPKKEYFILNPKYNKLLKQEISFLEENKKEISFYDDTQRYIFWDINIVLEFQKKLKKYFKENEFINIMEKSITADNEIIYIINKKFNKTMYSLMKQKTFSAGIEWRPFVKAWIIKGKNKEQQQKVKKEVLEYFKNNFNEETKGELNKNKQINITEDFKKLHQNNLTEEEIKKLKELEKNNSKVIFYSPELDSWIIQIEKDKNITEEELEKNKQIIIEIEKRINDSNTLPQLTISNGYFYLKNNNYDKLEQFLEKLILEENKHISKDNNIWKIEYDRKFFSENEEKEYQYIQKIIQKIQNHFKEDKLKIEKTKRFVKII